MTCPSCGAPVQSNDLYCFNCGHAMRPANPTSRLDDPVATAGEPGYGPEPSPHTYGSVPAYAAESPSYTHGASPSYADETPAYSFGSPAPYGTPPPASNSGSRADSRGGAQNWATGSSFPAANPYAAPNTVSPGTMVNGRPVSGRGAGNGFLRGIGGGILVILLLLKGLGHTLAGIGILKVLGIVWLFTHAPVWVFILIVGLIVGGILRSQVA